MHYLVSYRYRSWHGPNREDGPFTISGEYDAICIIDQHPAEMVADCMSEYIQFRRREVVGSTGAEIVRLYFAMPVDNVSLDVIERLK